MLQRIDARTGLLGAVVVGGMISYCAQGKGWHYQAAPYSYSAILLSALLAARVWQAGERGRSLVEYLGLLVGMPQLLSVGLVAAAEIGRAGEGPHTPEPFVKQLIEDLDANATPGMPVQVFDTTHGAISALVRTGRRQPAADPGRRRPSWLTVAVVGAVCSAVVGPILTIIAKGIIAAHP